MSSGSIGVAVIGGGMAGRAHADGYRTASTLFGTDRPDVRLVAIADVNTCCVRRLPRAFRRHESVDRVPIRLSMHGIRGALDVMDYQWEVAVPFWKEIDALARDHDVEVGLELRPQNLVFNTADVRKLVALTGSTHLGVELDASHLFWQPTDPVAVVRELGPLVVHAAAKDVRINPTAALHGVLDNRFRRLSPDEDRTNLGGDEWVNEWPKDAAWDFAEGRSDGRRIFRWVTRVRSTDRDVQA